MCTENGACPGLDFTKLTEHCLKSSFRAMKVNYLQRLELLLPLLNSQNITVKVIHLVRDPRAAIVSWFNVWGNGVKNANLDMYR